MPTTHSEQPNEFDMINNNNNNDSHSSDTCRVDCWMCVYETERYRPPNILAAHFFLILFLNFWFGFPRGKQKLIYIYLRIVIHNYSQLFLIIIFIYVCLRCFFWMHPHWNWKTWETHALLACFSTRPWTITHFIREIFSEKNWLGEFGSIQSRNGNCISLIDAKTNKLNGISSVISDQYKKYLLRVYQYGFYSIGMKRKKRNSENAKIIMQMR